MPMFPELRMRRLRSLKLIKETRLSKDELILPLFIDEHIAEGKKPIASMPGQYRFSICLLYTSPSPRDLSTSRMPSSA